MSAIEEHALTPEERRHVAELLTRWLGRARLAVSAYNDATTRTLAAERRLGIPAAILGAIVATAVFATVEKDPALLWRIVTGVIALLAAVLTALQTFLRQAERTEQYREAARTYGRIRRRIERAMLFPPESREDALALLEDLSEVIDQAGRGKPNVPQRIWDRADYKINATSDARGMRALRLRLEGHLRFGVGARPVKALPEAHEQYFAGLDDAMVVELAKLHPTMSAHIQPASVATARERMREAASGARKRRAPLDVRAEGDGHYVVLDGNATFAVAQQDGWETIPVRILGALHEGEHEATESAALGGG